jgi:hypothetical protein
LKEVEVSVVWDPVIRYVPWGNLYIEVPWEFERIPVLISTAEVDDPLEESLAVLEVAGAYDDVTLDTDVSDELETGGVEELGSCELEAEAAGAALVEGGVELVDGSGVVVGELLGSDVVVGLVFDVLAASLAEPPSELEDDIVIVWLLSSNA